MSVIQVAGEYLLARQWAIRSPQGIDKVLVAPTQFTVLSTQGNQWRKLMWFYEDWKDDLNPLLSMHDLFVTDKGIYEELQLGFTTHLRQFMQRALAYAKKTAEKPQGEAYRWYYDQYLTHLHPEALPPFQGVLLLDSGGFVLGKPENWDRMKKVKNGPGADIADLMSTLYQWEQEGQKPQQYLEYGVEAQRLLLDAGLGIQPDIIVTLDRVVHYEMPAHLKEWYIEFNISNASSVLRYKASYAGPQPLYWAVLHPWGPSLTELKEGKVERQAAVELYYQGYVQQLQNLLRSERQFGVQFDGFGMGSLVPIMDDRLLTIIGEAVQRAIADCGVTDRPLHAFGSTEPKARRLQQYGISSFDSTHHIVRARTRQAYNPNTQAYEKISSGLSCDCPVCRKHRTRGIDELFEDRAGVKEVSTVLIALHNYHTCEQAHLVEMRQIEEQLFPAPR